MLKPAYLRTIMVLFGLILLVYTLSYLEGILVPFAFAGLLAVLLNPLNNWLMRRMPKLLAISITVLVAILVVASLGYFLVTQMSQFSEALPQLKERMAEYLEGMKHFVNERFHLSASKQQEYIEQGLNQTVSSGGTVAVATLSAVGSIAIILTIIPVYVFLLLLYKPLLLEFIRQLFSKQNEERIDEILQEIKQVVQSYISGLLIEAGIVATLNVGALLIIGVPYAILIGIIGAILNLVPYVGGVIAIALPVLMSLISGEPSNALYSILAYGAIQFLDNNIIQPRIVASKVRINALMSVIAVLAGNELWGVGGMFLSIPIVAVLKIIFDRVRSLKPWGLLLGDDNPDEPTEPSLENQKKTEIS